MAWTSYFYRNKESFLLGSAPFIPGDLIKAVVAVLIGRKLSKEMKRIGTQ